MLHSLLSGFQWRKAWKNYPSKSHWADLSILCAKQQQKLVVAMFSNEKETKNKTVSDFCFINNMFS
jgi:hypothetical protein